MGELYGSGKTGIIQIMVKPKRKWHKYKDRIIKTLEEFVLCERFGWTPDYIKSMDYDTRYRFISMVAGISASQKK